MAIDHVTNCVEVWFEKLEQEQGYSNKDSLEHEIDLMDRHLGQLEDKLKRIENIPRTEKQEKRAQVLKKYKEKSVLACPKLVKNLIKASTENSIADCKYISIHFVKLCKFSN